MADIVLLSADDITTTGWDRRNPAATVIQQMGIHNVDTVLVEGEIRKQHGLLVAPTGPVCTALQATSDHVHSQALLNGGFDVSEEALYRRIGRTKASISEIEH